MPYAVGVSQDPDPARAIAETVGKILDSLGPSPDVVALFASGEHGTKHIDGMQIVINDALKPAAFIGCSASGLIGGSQEIEQGAAVVVWAGNTTGTGKITAHHLTTADLQIHGEFAGIGGGDGNAGNGSAGSGSGAHTMVLFADPHSFDIAAAIDHWAQTSPDMKVIGGFLSANQSDIRLLKDNQPISTNGAVALLVEGETEVLPLVSQGCKPIGQPLVITDSTKNVIRSLGGETAADRIRSLGQSISDEDAALLGGGLLIGRVVNEHQTEFGRGDFLIRNIVGADEKSGAIAIADEAPLGATVQFHVRDASTAHDDLLALLMEAGPAQGALLFTCNGRGSHMFDEATHPSHDATALADITDGGAVAGMFCAGEIGPIGGKAAIHGFTASAAVFRDPA